MAARVRWPDVHAAVAQVVAALPGLSGVPVYDGPPVTGDSPTEYVTVGYVDGEDSAGDFTHDRADTDGWQWSEVGLVRCEFVAYSGAATDLPGLRALVFARVDALAAAVAADQTLGVLPAGATAALVGDVVPVQSQAGSAVRVAVSVTYQSHS